MNGIPNSPAAGYDQVRRATIAFNTVVNCRQSIVVGYRSPAGSSATLAPRDCAFVHNVVVGTAAPLVHLMTTPSGTSWRGNFLFGAEAGVRDEIRPNTTDPLLFRAGDGLWRPTAASPVVGAATDPMMDILLDIDGQMRSPASDAGCDQVSEEPVRFRPLTEGDVGPAWRRPQAWRHI